jgi:carboxymethylenebutenolidase
MIRATTVDKHLQDLQRVLDSIPKMEVTRRGLVMSALATGFALAVQPVSAETVTTDADALTVGDIIVPTRDVPIPAYRAMPSQGRRFPMVLVVQEIFGVHEHIKDVCRRLAKLGYLAVAPELYARQGDVSKLANNNDIMTKVVSKVADAQVLADLDATVAWADDSGRGHIEKLGITGFCWGGRIVWLYAAHNRQLKAGVAWYGRLAGTHSEMQPQHPIDLVGSLNAPVLGLYGGNDPGIPLETVEAMRQALKAAGNASQIVVYPDTPHGFHADYRPSYRKDQAQDGWNRLQAWFKQHGVA